LPLICFTLHNFKGAQRTLSDASAASIAKPLRDKAQLVIRHSECAFHAGFYAFPAAIAHRFINMDNFSLNFHRSFLLGQGSKKAILAEST
jgi:hypothetical protein